MTKPINLYLQSRISDEISFNRVERHSSGKIDICKTHNHEINSLKVIVDELINCGCSLEMLDGFFYGYHIPQIGKEFDLLKFTNMECINIELKSQSVPIEQILAQLKKNKYYLSHLKQKVYFYTVITDTMTCYTLDGQVNLKEVDLSEIVNHIQYFPNLYLNEIDGMFRASDYLVSPLNTPDRFINGEYFLTQAQEQIQRKVLGEIQNHSGYGFYALTGKPGTGKTLLLYDIAKKLSGIDKTLVIHCGKLSNGQEQLNHDMCNFRVINAGYLRYNFEIINNYRYILVDEAHRIYVKHYDTLCETVANGNKVCIFSSDPEQILSHTEKENGIVKKFTTYL